MTSTNRQSPVLAIYHGTFKPAQDGTMTTLSKMVAAFENAGWRIVVLTPDPPAENCPPNVHKVRSVRFPFYTAYAVALPSRKKVWARLDEINPDIVQIGTPDLGGKCVLKWALDRKIPVVGAYHTHFPTYLRYYKIGFLEGYLWREFRWFYNHCEYTMVPTHRVAAELEENGIQRTVEWSRGVNTALYNPERRKESVRKKYGAGPEDVLFAYAGRLVAEKNVMLVARAWQYVRKHCPHARLLWIGKGPMQPKLEKLTPEAAFPGYLLEEELAEAYAAADVIVFPSVTEGFGNVVQEGMACGVPAIGIDRGGVGELIGKNERGLAAQSENPKELASLMIRLYRNPKLRRRLAKRALKFAQSRKWEDVFNRQIALYDEILRKHKEK